MDVSTIPMHTARKSTTITGLDIEADSIAAAAVTTNGSTSVGEVAIAPLAPGIAREGEISDPDALADALKELFAEHKLPKAVRVGIANQRVVVRTIRMPVIENEQELETAIRFQAHDHIPMELDQAVLDWQVLEDNPELCRSGQMDVVVVAARLKMVADLTATLDAAGLKPVGIDVSAFAMIRALAGEAPTVPMLTPSYEDRDAGLDSALPLQPASLLCNFGDTTNLAVARGSSCLFTRVSHFGLESIVQALSEQHGLTLEHSRKWLLHVGLERPIEAIAGDPQIVAVARDALREGLAKLAGELRLSLDYYGAQETAMDVQEIVICGDGSAIDGIAEQVQSELGYAVRCARPAALAHLDSQDAARLTLPYGLGLER